MDNRIIIEDVWDGIRAQPGRAGLSALAIAVGTVALTILLAALSGLQEKAQRLVQELGVNVMAIVSDTQGTSETARQNMDERRAELLKANLPGCRFASVRIFPPLPSDAPSLMRVLATDENFKDVRQWRLLRGRFLDRLDIKDYARSAVITEDLSGLPGWELGRVVNIRNLPFTIVGVVAADTESLEMENSNTASLSGKRSAFVPITTARQWLDAASPDLHDLDALFIRTPERAAPTAVLSAAQRILAAPDTSCVSCTWITPDKMLAGIRKMQSTILLTVGLVSLLCLVLGGTTLASLMIANVRDRIPEIGLRRALGATPRDISALFVVEGLLVAGVGALGGAVAAHVFLVLTGSVFPCPIKLGIATVLLPAIMSLIVGGLASHRPARTAAAIAPAEALRAE